MRVSILSHLFFLPVLALGLAVPRQLGPGPGPGPGPFHHDKAVAGSTASDALSIFFSVPCHGCFDDNEGDLELELNAEASTHACESSSVFLNGIRLTPVAKENVQKGSLLSTIASTTSREILLSWEMSCLGAEVSFLSMHIMPRPGQYEVTQPSGFAVSFRQGRELEFLRLEPTPVPDVTETSIEHHWTIVQEKPEFVVVPSSTLLDQSIPDEVQRELQKLYQIKAAIGRLHHRYVRQEHHILDMIKHDFQACHGPRCLFQTAMKKAPDFFKLVKAHFRHRPDWSKHRGNHINFDEMYGDQKQAVETMSFEHDTIDQPVPVHAMDHPPPPRPPPPHGHKEHHPFPGHHGPGHHRPHFWHRHGPHRHPFFFSFGTMFVFITVASLLFTLLRRKTDLFRNERRKRDRAARREESRNRAAYRSAALRHRLERWWSHFRDPESSGDYEEKRSRILEQEGVLEDVMQSEIRDIRRAHEIVGEMMRADGQRHRLYHQVNFDNPSRTILPSGYSESEERGNTHPSAGPLPLYQPPPPSYELELEDELMVVDGFTYTPSQTDSTPESSVVDCGSRMSFDTNTTVTKD